METFKYQNQNNINNSDIVNIDSNVINNNNADGEVSLKENNRNELNNHEKTQVFNRKKRCC